MFLNHLPSFVHSLDSLQELLFTLVDGFGWVLKWCWVFRELLCLKVHGKLLVEIALLFGWELLVDICNLRDFSFEGLKLDHQLVFLFFYLFVLLLSFLLEIGIKAGHFFLDLFLSGEKGYILGIHLLAFFVKGYDLLLDFAEWLFHIIFNFFSFLSLLLNRGLDGLLYFLDGLLNFLDWESQSLPILNGEESLFVHLIKNMFTSFLVGFHSRLDVFESPWKSFQGKDFRANLKIVKDVLCWWFGRVNFVEPWGRPSAKGWDRWWLYYCFLDMK